MLWGEKAPPPCYPPFLLPQTRPAQLWPVLDQWNEIAAVFSELWQGGKKEYHLKGHFVFSRPRKWYSWKWVIGWKDRGGERERETHEEQLLLGHFRSSVEDEKGDKSQACGLEKINNWVGSAGVREPRILTLKWQWLWQQAYMLINSSLSELMGLCLISTGALSSVTWHKNMQHGDLL